MIDRTAWWKPGPGAIWVSVTVGVATFCAVLLFGPETAQTRSPSGANSGIPFRSSLTGDVHQLIAFGDDDAAINVLETHLKTDPHFQWAWWRLHQLASRNPGHEKLVDRAREELLRTLDRRQRNRDWAWQSWDRRPKAAALRLAGEDPAPVLREGIELILTNPGLEGPSRDYLVGVSLALLGETDGAFESIALAVEQGFPDPGWLGHAPELDPIRADPRMDALLERARLIRANQQMPALTEEQLRGTEEQPDADSSGEDGPQPVDP